MGTYYFDKLFNPTSIAVIGASDKPNSVGLRVFKNLSNYSGKLYPVNPKHTEIQGQRAYASVNEINQPIDLAVITTPAQTVPTILRQCGEKGIHAAVIISAGFSEAGMEGKALEQSFLEMAHQYNIRIIGPNCLGIMRPSIQLNATFDNNMALAGNIALVSQSGAICAAILDWAIDKKIGFSSVVSLGNAADVDFGEIVDFLALDPKTKSILLYIEGVHDARRFMSGLRAAGRMKPVIVIKGGRFSQGSRAAHSHTGALVGDDDVFAAALGRAGAVRVLTIEQLFSAAEILSSNYRSKGNRLAIITNGGGAGVMAADRASELQVNLAALSDQTLTRLNAVLPSEWSHQNPVDIIGDAPPERYRAAIDICSQDDNIDGLLTILVPVAVSNPLKVAEEVIAEAKKIAKPLITNWMGEKHVRSAWELFSDNKIPNFKTPEEAVEAFSYLAEYHHNQQLLMQVPEPLSPQPTPDINAAKLIIESALAEKRDTLSTMESKAILQLFGIPTTKTIEVHSANEAATVAASLSFPIVMKINSPDITHKTDAGGVQLNIESAEIARETYDLLIKNAKAYKPDAVISGVTLERMYLNPNNRELLIGVIRDKVFGPVITFGAGGTLVEIIHDRAIALPPLNQLIAKNLIEKTRTSKLLGAFRNMPPANLEAITNILLRVSEMICELPSIQEMDINPLIANNIEAIAVDARIVVAPTVPSTTPYSHMAICPYPAQLVSTWKLPNGMDITIRPIRPEDAQIERDFISHLSPQAKYFRFMEHLQELTPSMLVRFTQIDYDREMALISTYQHDGAEVNIGVARYIINPDRVSCEFAIVVADEWQNKGLGTHLLSALMAAAKHHGVITMSGEIMTTNAAMLELVKYLGFTIANSEDERIKIVTKVLA